MPNGIAHLALVVRDYNEAIRFYTGSLGFQLLEDVPLGDGSVAVFLDLYGNRWDLVQQMPGQPSASWA